MSQSSGDWTFYILGISLMILGALFFLVPFISRSGSISSVKIPWYILYVYKSGGFYFATSPILLVISAITIVVFLLRR